MLVPRSRLPKNLAAIPEIDVGSDLTADPLQQEWILLGAWSDDSPAPTGRVVEEVATQALLIDPADFERVYDKLRGFGDTLHGVGSAEGYQHGLPGRMSYAYDPLHQAMIGTVRLEPLVFRSQADWLGTLMINPDLLVNLNLKPTVTGSGDALTRSWLDARRACEVLRQEDVQGRWPQGEVVEIRRDYLLRYLKARQQALLIAHFKEIHLFEPTRNEIRKFRTGDRVLGSLRRGSKVLLQNWGLRSDTMDRRGPFLQRRLHLWIKIDPPRIDSNDPWAEEVSFDLTQFTFPTRSGPVAPARFLGRPSLRGKTFAGTSCDFMDRVYFRQEVLETYQGSAGFRFGDDGAVHCQHYWALARSTHRLANAFLSTAIGDFAEAVPVDEWQHWGRFAIEPPDERTVERAYREKAIPDAVNDVMSALTTLDLALAESGQEPGIDVGRPLWRGSADSLAATQLRYVYPDGADDAEFLKRALLLSTLVLEGFDGGSLRRLLQVRGAELIKGADGKPLGSRRLLERLVLVAELERDLLVSREDDPTESVRVAEAAVTPTGFAEDLARELRAKHAAVRASLSALAFLYELRSAGGLAHAPGTHTIAAAAAGLGLPARGWSRRDYLGLLSLVAGAVSAAEASLRAEPRSPPSNSAARPSRRRPRR